MKLTRLELSGFKSFADDLNLPFEDGITAIVGPNGCGKSNISDAVRWVLGEQRASVLRGSKMDDVIFQGSAGRKPTNVAEVSLFFDNSDDTLPISYNEVVLTRRLSRSGQSDYLINNSPVRLRDVQDLLRGTGLGTDSGVVIEARMIDRLLSDKAEERRSLFEDAAGIGLYRDRRNTTERRLDRTRDDLLRLDDLISEIHTQVRSLARQKGKAERHKQFTDERFHIVMTLTRHDLAKLDLQERELTAQRSAHEEEIPRISQRIAAAQESRESRVQERASAEAKRSQLDRDLADLRVELEKLGGDLKLGEERIRTVSEARVRATTGRQEAEQKVVQASREHDAATRERSAATKDLEDVQSELSLRTSREDENQELVRKQRGAVKHASDNLLELTEKSRSLSGEATAIEAEIADIQNERSSAEVRLNSAREEGTTGERSVENARSSEAAMSSAHQSAAAELERARHSLAVARESDTAIQVERRSLEQECAQLSARQEALEELERNRVGLAPAARQLLDATDAFAPGEIIGPLADFIKPETGRAEVAERVLSGWLHAVLVSDESVIERVRKWHLRQNPGPLVLLPVQPGPREPSGSDNPVMNIVTMEPAEAWVRALIDGIEIDDAHATVVVRPNGAVFLHEASKSTGPLGRREELDSQRERLMEVNENLAAAIKTAAETAEALSNCEHHLATASESGETARDQHREALAKLEDAERRLEHTNREIARATDSLSRLAERQTTRSARLAEIAELQSTTGKRREAFEDDLDTHTRSLEDYEQALGVAQEKRVHWQVEEAQLSAREQSADERQQRSAREASIHKDRGEELSSELDTIGLEEAELRGLQTQRRDGIAERRRAVAEMDSATTRAEQSVSKAEELLGQSDDELVETRDRQDKNTATIHRIEIELTELTGRKTATVERVEGEWDRSLDELLEDVGEVEGDMEAMREEAAKLKVAIEAIGPVNPLAVEEHQQELERFEFLSSQRDDLVEAREGLMRALKEMDVTAREMFLEAFDDIRENYLKVFNTLFEGGTCDLKLANPDDPLNSEIDIHAAPKGKRTQRIHLLSSGERALVAISLLFAIYLAKPSPFCLLDEVDAPLDDNNVLRFVRLLDEFKDDTQFIVITHNPRTMQIADSVYGVTMQEPGISKIVGVRLGEAEAVTT